MVTQKLFQRMVIYPVDVTIQRLKQRGPDFWILYHAMKAKTSVFRGNSIIRIPE